MVDGARDYAIFMVNPSNEIVYWSAAGAERVFGWSAADAVGQLGEIVFTPEDRENEQEERKSKRRCEKAAQAIGAGTFARTARESGWTA